LVFGGTALTAAVRVTCMPHVLLAERGASSSLLRHGCCRMRRMAFVLRNFTSYFGWVPGGGMTRSSPLSGGVLGIAGSMPFGGWITLSWRLSFLLSVPGCVSGTGLVGTGFGSTFSGGVLVGSPERAIGGEACPAACSASSNQPSPPIRANPNALRSHLCLCFLMYPKRPRIAEVS
jgi:hypothetical protein